MEGRIAASLSLVAVAHFLLDGQVNYVHDMGTTSTPEQSTVFAQSSELSIRQSGAARGRRLRGS